MEKIHNKSLCPRGSQLSNQQQHYTAETMSKKNILEIEHSRICEIASCNSHAIDDLRIGDLESANILLLRGMRILHVLIGHRSESMFHAVCSVIGDGQSPPSRVSPASLWSAPRWIGNTPTPSTSALQTPHEHHGHRSNDLQLQPLLSLFTISPQEKPITDLQSNCEAYLFNRAFEIRVLPSSLGMEQPETVSWVQSRIETIGIGAALIYNLALVYHAGGLRTGSSTFLRRAIALYQQALLHLQISTTATTTTGTTGGMGAYTQYGKHESNVAESSSVPMSPSRSLDFLILMGAACQNLIQAHSSLFEVSEVRFAAEVFEQVVCIMELVCYYHSEQNFPSSELAIAELHTFRVNLAFAKLQDFQCSPAA
jgi:hypothetical protein